MEMKPTIATLLPFSVLIAAWLVVACATPAGTVAVVAAGNVTRNNARTLPVATVTVGVPRHSASPASSTLSAIAPVAVQMLPFNDDRTDLDVEGRSTAAFGVPMGKIRFEPSPASLLGQAIVSELQAAGHTVTDRANSAQVAGAIVEFEAHTDTTLMYWDVIGNLAVSLQIAVARGKQPGTSLDYRARCVERTYIWPSEAVIASVMGKCIRDFADRLRIDGRAAGALRGASSGL